MSADFIFSICGNLVLPGWLLLILLPNWRWTLALVTAVIIPFTLGVVYISLMISQLGNLPEGVGFGSIEAVRAGFSNDYILVAGWVHYLAFDLFVGAWAVRNSQKIGLSHWFVMPCLALTFMLGPTGLAVYLLMRFVKTRNMQILEPVDA
ncbi:MAG: ABA4-like family protein [Gammaproteobacteria bacterium]|nr:ABA4-like family protein [Gammaproteobacteria bacterium]